jgi:NADPH-dependent curcumin reductase CurA
MNKQVLLKSRPDGLPTSSDFEVVSTPLPTLSEDEVLVRVDYLSVDPTQVGNFYLVWLSGVTSYMPPVKIGEVVRSFGVGTVISSKSSIKAGSLVSGLLGWQEFCKIKSSKVIVLPPTSHPTHYLGLLGMTGLTAFVSMKDLGMIKKKDVVVVSTAAGAVGSIAVQIAKATGCKVVGITGSEAKAAWLRQLKLDGVINYKTDNIANSLKTLCPEGIDVFLDNVGGETLDAVLINCKRGARIVLCGAIQSYGKKTAQPVYNYPVIISRNITMIGFVVIDFQHRIAESNQYLNELLAAGKIQHKEDVVVGIENCYLGLRKLLTGENIGKMIISVSNEHARI